jgi:hypothetical protein
LQSTLLRNAFERAVEVLGESSKEALLEDLKKHGLFFDDPEITLSKLVHALREVIGQEATELLAERLIIKLDELHSQKK